MRRLNRTLMAGGVVYPAGTREDEIDAEVRRDDVWEDVDVDAVASTTSIPESDHPVTAELREACEYLVERHLADKDVPVATLLAGALEIFSPDDDNTDDENTGDGDGGDGEPALPQVPAKSAAKADWVAYATHEAHGDAALTEQAAKAMTRDQLADQFAPGGDA